MMTARVITTIHEGRSSCVKKERDNLQDALRDGIFATPTPRGATGHAQQAPWRTEPEIGLERQEQLIRCLATTPDIRRGIYPFKGMKLSRADIEWLLATYENGGGPSAPIRPTNDAANLEMRPDNDAIASSFAQSGRKEVSSFAQAGRAESNRPSLDLRGADLRYVDLHALPLARVRGSLTREEWDEATEEQRANAAVLLTGADLSEAHLEEAELIGAHLEKVSLHEAHLEKANLARARLERAFLARAHLREADLSV